MMDWFLSKGCPSITTVPQFIDKLDILGKYIDKTIGRGNMKAVLNALKLQKWTFIRQDFSIPGGELGKDLCLNIYPKFILRWYRVRPGVGSETIRSRV